MTRATRGALALASAVILAACGTTYVESTTERTVGGGAPPTTVAVDRDAPLPELLGDLRDLMSGLDEEIIEQDRHVATLERIDAVWSAAEPRIRRRDPDDVYAFEQAIELARSGVERRRPADASRGYKILVDVVRAYLEQLG